MRKHALLLAASLLFVPSAVGAMVIEPGTIEIGGATQFAYSNMTFKNGTDTDTSSFGIDAIGAYYVIPNLGVGAAVTYQSTEVENDSESSLSLGPVVKYSFPIAEQANVFGLASAGFQSYSFVDDTEADGWYASIGGGASFFLSNSVSLDGLVKYTYNSLDWDGHDYTAGGFFLGAGLSIYMR